jgi:hypothetical protein
MVWRVSFIKFSFVIIKVYILNLTISISARMGKSILVHGCKVHSPRGTPLPYFRFFDEED